MNPFRTGWMLIDKHSREAGPIAMLIVSLLVLGVAAAVYFGAPQAADYVVPNGPAIPPDLADHQDRGPGLERGSSVGATPNKAIARPSTYFEERGIKYTFAASPNWSGRGTNPIVGIVLHVTGPGTCPGMTSWFSNPAAQASANFAVCKDGSVIQYVEVGDAAWHAGIVTKPDLTNAMVAGFVNSGINPNSQTVGIEVLLAPGEKLEDYPAMKSSLVALMRWLSTTVGIPLDATHVIGHNQIDSVNRSVDPVCCYSVASVLQALSVPMAGGEGPSSYPTEVGFTRWVGEANPAFWHNQAISGKQGVWASYDFNLPVDARAIEVEFFLASGGLTVWDGGTYPYGRACYVTAGVGRCTVFLDGNGWFDIEGDAVLDKMVITGILR